MKIAIVGSGIAGISCAWLLSQHAGGQHQVTLFEQNATLGGHTNTIDVTFEGKTFPVDTGFLVFNDWTYPNLIAMFKHLKIEDALSDMSFSVKLTDRSGMSRIEWSGSNLATVFSQPSNLFRPRFLSMVRDIVRFNREATALATQKSAMLGTVGEYLAANKYSTTFRDWYLAPMAGCIWSTPTKKIEDFPLATLLTFCHNHGLLSVNHRPQWRTVKGGARHYLAALAPAIPDMRLNAAVERVTRHADHVMVRSAGQDETFDHVVFACHTDQTLSLLADATDDEREALGAIRYQPNTAILHTDARVLPVRRRAWASWNFQSDYTQADANSGEPVSLTYLINRLQPVPFKAPVLVTMNPKQTLDPAKIIKTIQYDHPIFEAASVRAKRNVRRLQGKHRSWFAGAWTRYGFHEDGLMSSIAVAKALGAAVPWQTHVPAANDIATPYPGVDN
jgi:uncharacterized protein